MLTWLKAAALSALAVVAPAKTMLLAALALTALDSVSGILAARKRGERITSAGFRRTVSKGLVYTIAILAAFLGERYLLEDAVSASKLVAGAIGVVEGKSILENVETVLGRPVFSSIIARLGSHNDKGKTT